MPVALLDSGGKVAERVRYDAYGNADHHAGLDVDGDRDADSGDSKALSTLMEAWIGAGPLPITAPAYRAELYAFVEVAAGRMANPCPPEDAREAIRIAMACDRSRELHRPVCVAEVA